MRTGDYRFRVEARTANGTWGQEGKVFSFSMQPHFRETWWPFLLGAVGLGGAGFVTYRWRVAALRSQQRELTLKVDERTADLSREIAEHKKTEERLQSQMAERERAELEARQFAEKLAESNATLLERQDAIQRENAERRRAEEKAAMAAERLSRANQELLTNHAALEDKQAALERENGERRRAEEEARQAGEEAGRERDLLRALMNNIPDLIYFKDRESRYTRINKAHADALDLRRPEDAAGKSDFDFHPAEFARASRDDEREILTTGRPLVGRIEHEPQRDRWYLATKVPLLDAAGQATGIVGISKDITDRRRTEEQLEHDLQAFLEVVDAVAKGDLTRRAKSGEDTLGRIARSVNQMLEGFVLIVSELRDAAFSVSTSSAEILAAATQIAKGAKSGSDQVHSTSAAVEEMAASMAQVSRSAHESADSSKRVLEHVRAGNESVAATYHGMTQIDRAVTETVHKMALLEKSSRQIFKIIALIEEIASQSNLLSLNAAIEAAHAGDAGRGFGVVADEIRRLAERSTVATKDVTTIVEGIVEETRVVMQAMESGIAEIHSGSELSARAQKSLLEIQALAQASAQLSDSISAASSEQARATQTMAQAMQAISNIAQQSSAGASETSRAVQDLVSLSEQLSRTISVFKIDAGVTPSRTT